MDEDTQPSWMQYQGLDNAGVQAHYSFVFKERNAPPAGVVLREISDRRSEKLAVTSPRVPRRTLEDRVYNSLGGSWIGPSFVHEPMVSPVVGGSNSI